MGLVIPRGIVYHDLSFDILSLIKSTYQKLDDEASLYEFEKEFARYNGTKYCVAFSFTRTAIFYALKSQNFPINSEIIMPPITIKAILDVVLDLKLKPVFVDIDPDTLCFDLKKLKTAITANTKAILITYLFGIVPNVKNLIDLSRDNNLFIVEDFSHCINSKYREKEMGTFGDVGVYSSSSIKTFDIYGGGLLICNNGELYSQLSQYKAELSKSSRRQLMQSIITDLARNFATQRLVFHCVVFPLIKLYSRMNPGSAMKHTGSRNREPLKTLPRRWFTKFTSFQAKLGLASLGNVEIQDNQRIKNVEFIKSLASDLKYPKGGANGRNVYWQFIAYFDSPTRAQNLFFKKGVDTATTSLELISNLPAYEYQGNTPNAERLHKNGLFLPCYPGLNKYDLQHIANAANEASRLLS